MSTKYHDIVIAKQFETRQSGQVETRTVWNKVGQAWNSRKSDGYNFELYLMPGQRFFIDLRDEDDESWLPPTPENGKVNL